MKMKDKKEIVGEYVGHVFMGFVMCATLVIMSAALIILIRYVSAFVHDPLYTEVMDGVEEVLMAFDVLTLIVWVLYSAYKAAMEMRGDAK